MQTIVLNGTGPHIKVKVGADNSKILVVSKSKTTKLTLGKSSEIKFAA